MRTCKWEGSEEQVGDVGLCELHKCDPDKKKVFLFNTEISLQSKRHHY